MSTSPPKFSAAGVPNAFYMDNYLGPKLKRAILVDRRPGDCAGYLLSSEEIDALEVSEDITERIRELYGPERNWRGLLYRAGAALEARHLGKTLKMDFYNHLNPRFETSKNPNHVICRPSRLDDVLNPPLYFPFSLTDLEDYVEHPDLATNSFGGDVCSNSKDRKDKVGM